MNSWWIQDQSRHKRGPLTVKQINLLIRLGTVTDRTPIFLDDPKAWSLFSNCDSLKSAIADLFLAEDDSNTSGRLPLSEVPSLETMPCQDISCPNSPSCGVIYVWDRASEFWLTFEEYVKVCVEDGLLEGLPDRLVAESPEQIHELLVQADLASGLIGGKTKIRPTAESEDEALSDPEKEAKRQKRKAYRERKKLKRDAGLWVKTKTNPNVYVSSLPEGVTTTQLAALFSQAGQLKLDMKTGEPRIKLYGHGDALVTFVHAESVGLAIARFNEFEIAPGACICVQPADFQSTGKELDISVEELEARAEVNRENRKKQLEFARKEKEVRSQWDSTEHRGRVLPVIVFQNAFDPVASVDYEFVEQGLLGICSKFGPVVKVKAIANSIDGFVCVKFKNMIDAENCLASLAGTDIGNRPVTAFMHDGRDLTSRMLEVMGSEVVKSSEGPGWEAFLLDQVDSDDDDIQIRTE